jgi:hypothetical protein
MLCNVPRALAHRNPQYIVWHGMANGTVDYAPTIGPAVLLLLLAWLAAKWRQLLQWRQALCAR